MEDQHMTQQVFADFLQQSPATLSSIYTGRTRPTLNVIDAIKTKIPDISVEWLLYGTGERYLSQQKGSADKSPTPATGAQEGSIIFDSPTSGFTPNPQQSASAAHFANGVNNTRLEMPHEEMKIFNKEPHKITEIRVYYDDQTYETFVPAKK